MNRMLPCLLGLLVFVALPVRAEPRELGVDLGSGSLRVMTQSASRLTGLDNYAGAWLHAHSEVVPNTEIGVGWWHPTAATDGLRQWSGQAAVIDVRARYPLASWLQPYGRAGLGALWQSLELSSTNAGHLTAAQVLPLGSAALGCDLVLPRSLLGTPGGRMLFNIGLTFEVGWLQTLTKQWVADSDRGSSVKLAQSSVDLGSATLAGVWSRVALAVRF